jgi:hypothetical protein
MAKKSHIKKLYHFAENNLEHVKHSKFVLEELQVSKERLESVTRLLKRWTDFHPLNCESYINVIAEDKFWLRPAEDISSYDYFKPVSQLSFEKIFDNLTWTHSDLDHIHDLKDLDAYSISKYLSRRDRVENINEELRVLKQELRNRFSKDLLQKVRELVHELHSIVSSYFKKQYKHVNRLSTSETGFMIRDIRNFLRQTVQIIFKNLPDFSGCEEEAEFTYIVNFKPLFLFNKQKHHVQHKVLT